MHLVRPARVLLGNGQNTDSPVFCHSDRRLDLVPLVSDPTWRFDQDNLWRLPGAHGDEVVRSVYLDEQVCTSHWLFPWLSVYLAPLADAVYHQSQSVFTCGEDGFVRAWKPAGEDGNASSQAGTAKGARSKPERKQKDRFKPY